MLHEARLLGGGEVALHALEHLLGSLPVPHRAVLARTAVVPGKVHPKDVAVVVPAVLAAHVLHHVVHEGRLEVAQLEAALVTLE